MDELFVPYQEAFELKELGFDKPCFGKYLSSLQSDWKEFELILKRGMNEEFENNRNIYLLEGACSAPTFSQAFKWFREKYKLHYSIELVDNSRNYYFDFTIYDSRNRDYNDEDCFDSCKRIYDDGKYNTYEEAELACLRKLIKIIKNETK